MKYLIILTLFILSACSSQHKKPVDNIQKELIPLSIGNSWAYIDTVSGKKLYAKVDTKQEINGVTWYRYNEFGDLFWVRNEGEKQFEAIDYFGAKSIDQVSDINESVVLRTDVAAYEFSGDNKASYKPCSRPTKVPAGTFDCHIITFDLGEDQFSASYYAPGVGLIKISIKQKCCIL